MRSQWPQRGPVYLGAVIFLALNALIWRGGREGNMAPPLADFGQPFPFASAKTINDTGLEWNARWFLLIYSSTDAFEGIRVATYTSRLCEQYRDRHLTCGILLNGDGDHIRRVIAEQNLSSTGVLQPEPAWISRLRLNVSQWGAILVTPTNTFAFHADFVKPGDIRQLIERYLLGAITYGTDATHPRLAVGSTLPPIRVQDINTGTIRRLIPSQYENILVITARCASCSLEPSLLTLQARIRRSPTHRDNAVLILSSRFTLAEAQAAVRHTGGQARVFHSVDPIPLVEDSYTAESLFSGDTVVIRLKPHSSTVIGLEETPWI